MAAGLGTTAVASADPINNPNAVTQNFVCGGVPVTLTILSNGSAAAFTSSTSVGIAVTGSPGIPKSAVQTTTCTTTINGQQFSVTAFFTPPGH
jgi:hypothetical protein